MRKYMHDVHIRQTSRRGLGWRLTVKLRGRAEASAGRRGRTLSSSARGAKQITHHGPLQRLLEDHTALRNLYVVAAGLDVLLRAREGEQIRCCAFSLRVMFQDERPGRSLPGANIKREGEPRGIIRVVNGACDHAEFDGVASGTHRRVGCGHLTVKLRGRIEAPDHGAEGAQFPSARGANPEAPHGPLQRLLEGT